MCAVCLRLEQADVRYVVVSGTAVVLHGFDRPLGDLDIVISSEPGGVERAMRELALSGFVPSIPLPMSLVSVMRMFDANQREIDVFVRYAVPFEELWTHSESRALAEGTIRIISREHLLRVKRLGGRPHDLEDIQALLASGERPQ